MQKEDKTIYQGQLRFILTRNLPLISLRITDRPKQLIQGSLHKLNEQNHPMQFIYTCLQRKKVSNKPKLMKKSQSLFEFY